jgi:predicted ATP-grasp superfamily ATP-dependent carboligase
MTWGGGGNAGAIVDEPELLRQARAVIAALGGWAGPVNLEFKRHRDNGRFYLMEVNCRLNGYSYLTTMNGLNFPAAVVDLLHTGRTPYLSLSRARPVRNFVVGFRELPVKDWCSDAA